jgi:L-iditol 2-dehydrogenase
MRRCGRCVYCRRGLDNHCAYVRPAGFDGLPAGPRGLSDRLSVPPYQVFRLAGTVGRTGGALVEPLACVLRSVRMARPSPARLALVLGAGTMGLIHAAVLTHLGSRVLVADQDRTLIEHAERMGFEAMVLSSDEELRRHVRAMSEDDGAETVFCIRGGTTAVQLGATAVARGGRLMLFQSIPPSDAVVLSANDLHYREVQMIGTISQTLADFQAAVDLLSSLPNLLSCLITQAVPASNVRDAFELALEHRVNRVLVTFGDAQFASPA